MIEGVTFADISASLIETVMKGDIMTEYVITEEWQWPDDPYGLTTVLCVAHSKEVAMAWVEKYADEHHHSDEYRFAWNQSKTTYYAWGPHGSDYTGYRIKPVKVV